TTTDTTDATSTTTTTAPAGGERCEHPQGFEITATDGWLAAETGEECSRWHPVDGGSDDGAATVTATVEATPYADAATTAPVTGEARVVAAVDGRQAVRLSMTGVDSPDPDGSPVTRYVVDLTSSDGDPRTLFLDATGEGDGHADASAALDRMVRTLDVTAADVDDDPSIVATFLGGGGGFSVTAEHGEEETCLRIPPDGEPICTEHPAPDQLHTIALQDLDERHLAGVVGSEVWQIDLVARDDGTVHSYLATPVPDSDLGAFASMMTLDEVEQIVLRDLDGREIRTITPGG
ncbi:MAG: hypothetical protein ACLFRV_12115, partial [Acidimicrobiales bacterium]